MTSSLASSASPRENLFWIHLLRAVVSFGVIVVHVAADVITEWKAVPMSWWWAANIYDSMVRGCVAMFIMISGALLLPVSEGIVHFFTKRFNRLAVPFAAWILLYLLWKKFFYVPDMTWNDALQMVLTSKVHFHLWFIYSLTGLYLITPIFRVFAAHAPKRVLIYFLILWFCFTSLVPFAESASKIFAKPGFHLHLPMEPVQGFIGYFILGYFLRQFAERSWLMPAAAIWTGSFFLCLIGTYCLIAYLGKYHSLFYENLAPNVVLYTGAFFVIVKHWGSDLEKHSSPALRQAVLLLSRCSLGIYLIHPMIIDTLTHARLGFMMAPGMAHPGFMIPCVTIVVYAISLAAVWGIQQIPVLKRVV